jgi:hypothetical protein
MRTTLTLDDEVYEAARKIAFQQRRALGDVISELAAKGMAAEDRPAPRRKLGFWAGQGWIADDFNDTPPEWLESIEADL